MEDTQQEEKRSSRRVDVNGRPSWPYEEWKYVEDIPSSKAQTDSNEYTEESSHRHSENHKDVTNSYVVQQLHRTEDAPDIVEVKNDSTFQCYSNAESEEGNSNKGQKRKKDIDEDLEVQVGIENVPNARVDEYRKQMRSTNTGESLFEGSECDEAIVSFNVSAIGDRVDLVSETIENKAIVDMEMSIPENTSVPRKPDVQGCIEPTNAGSPTDTSEHDDICDYEPDHWSENLSEPLDETVPLQQLIAYMQPLVNVDVDKAKPITEAMTSMMLSTAEEIKQHYVVFKDCTVIPVGSMMENSKIGEADEFDFAVILPYFENIVDIMNMVYMKEHDKLIKDPGMISIAKDISKTQDGDITRIIHHLQNALKTVWSNFMTGNIPPGWKLSGSCHRDVSIAGTFHLTRLDDEFTVDVDVCFWTPIHESVLRDGFDELESREYIMKNCLDEQQKVFGILPTDQGINYSLNTVRFAMSLHERKMLNKFGVNNGRIKCYRLAKAVAKLFFPQTHKRETCTRCVDSLVSSFCLKNIVLFMIQNHPNDELWTDNQLGNRLLEVFDILNFCMMLNGGIVSAFFTPYFIDGPLAWRYDPKNHLVIGATYFTVTEDEAEWTEETDSRPGLLPDLQGVVDFFNRDSTSSKILENYRDFLQNTEWNGTAIIDRLVETLTGLREKEKEERERIANDPGGLCIQMFAGKMCLNRTSQLDFPEIHKSF